MRDQAQGAGDATVPRPRAIAGSWSMVRLGNGACRRSVDRDLPRFFQRLAYGVGGGVDGRSSTGTAGATGGTLLVVVVDCVAIGAFGRV